MATVSVAIWWAAPGTVPGLILIGADGLATLMLIVLGVRNLRVSLRRTEGGERRRILWLVQGFHLAAWMVVVPAAVLVVTRLIGGPAPLVAVVVFPVLMFAPVVIVASLGVAVFYDGALDPDLVIRKTALYGFLALLITFLFAGLEEALTSGVAERMGLSSGAAGWIAAGAAAVLMGPAHKKIDTMLGSERADAARPTDRDPGVVK